MEEIKPILVAILDRLETESARNEAFRMEMYKFQGEMTQFKDEIMQFKGEMLEFKDEMSQFKDEMLEFKGEMSQFQGEVRENFQDLQLQLDYIAGKLGEHDRDLHVIKCELV
ncbi:hypothetical protein E2R60_12185 [Paenibacillus dendritiformis]|uniref:hypothetical protein n=1 Tax=Paenibacillus dendritiformis TaxID=130049 RepID=UPI00105A45FD|nr:hypothetical protein [Paenibacillus dendritiformis]TDL53803.1 hypothetical protein E2R60_12185 [Paenibacillus dendritiformis]